jgi:hypothetical protein
MEYNREHAHIHARWPDEANSPKAGLKHPAGGGIIHVSLSHANCHLLIRRQWAEWHPYAVASFPHVLLYPPRSEDDRTVDHRRWLV